MGFRDFAPMSLEPDKTQDLISIYYSDPNKSNRLERRDALMYFKSEEFACAH